MLKTVWTVCPKNCFLRRVSHLNWIWTQPRIIFVFCKTPHWDVCFCRAAGSFRKSCRWRIGSMPLYRHSQKHIGPKVEPALWPVSHKPRTSTFPLPLCCQRSDCAALTLDKLIAVLWVFFFSYIGKTDSITISIWNHKKIHKRQGAGFLGCIRLLSNAISRLKDTGCKSDSAVEIWTFSFKINAMLTLFAVSFLRLNNPLLPSDQRLDLCRLNASDSDAVRGQIVGKVGHSELQSHFQSQYRLSIFSYC